MTVLAAAEQIARDAQVHAHTTYGRIGVKVWVYKGDVMPERKPVTEATLSADLAALPAD